MTEQESVNTFRRHYEQNRGNILATSFGAIQQAADKGESDMAALGDFKNIWDELDGGQDSVAWRSLSDLFAAGVIDTEKQGETTYIVPNTDSISRDVLEDVPDVDEYRDSLVHDETYSDRMEDDWISYDFKGGEVALPRFPVDFFDEHFQRNGMETEIHNEPSDKSPVARMLVTGDENTWGDNRRNIYVFNQSEEQEDFIQLEVDVFRPESQDEAFYSERNAMNWLGTVKNKELEPLIGDIENIYQQAYQAATGEHEAFSDEVEDLRDVRDRLNGQSQRTNLLSIADVIERSRESNEYFGDSGADRLRAPLAEYLHFGRNGSVAPVSAQYSDNSYEGGKVERGELMEEMYFDALEQFAEKAYDDFEEVPE